GRRPGRRRARRRRGRARRWRRRCLRRRWRRRRRAARGRRFLAAGRGLRARGAGDRRARGHRRRRRVRGGAGALGGGVQGDVRARGLAPVGSGHDRCGRREDRGHRDAGRGEHHQALRPGVRVFHV
ncbi:hypothetical protein E1181_29500, partial [Saccharopolyspora terrae]